MSGNDSNAISQLLSNDSQHFGNGDDVAGVENKDGAVLLRMIFSPNLEENI